MEKKSITGGVCPNCAKYVQVLEEQVKQTEQAMYDLQSLTNKSKGLIMILNGQTEQLESVQKELGERQAELAEEQNARQTAEQARNETRAALTKIGGELIREASTMCHLCGTKMPEENSVDSFRLVFDANLEAVKRKNQELTALKDAEKNLMQEKQALEEKLAKAQSDLENAKVAEERAQGYIGDLSNTARKTAMTYAGLLGIVQGDTGGSQVKVVCDMLHKCVGLLNDQAETIKGLEQRIGELSDQNTGLTDQNKRLQGLLAEANQDAGEQLKAQAETIKGLEQRIGELINEKEELTAQIEESQRLLAKANSPEGFGDEESVSVGSQEVSDDEEIDGDSNVLVFDTEVVMAAATEVFKKGCQSFERFTHNGFEDFAREFFDAKRTDLVSADEAEHSDSENGQLPFERDLIESKIGLLQKSAQAISGAVGQHSDGAVNRFSGAIDNALGLIETLKEDDKIVRWVMLSFLLDCVSETFTRERIFNRISAHKINDLCKDGKLVTVFQAVKSLHKEGFILYPPVVRPTVAPKSE